MPVRCVLPKAKAKLKQAEHCHPFQSSSTLVAMQKVCVRTSPLFLSQDYPDYEVIVVNDGEDSDSEDVLKILSSENKHLYYTYVPVDTQYLSHKKLALTMGIKAAKNDILLFTEANCQPLGQSG